MQYFNNFHPNTSSWFFPNPPSLSYLLHWTCVSTSTLNSSQTPICAVYVRMWPSTGAWSTTRSHPHKKLFSFPQKPPTVHSSLIGLRTHESLAKRMLAGWVWCRWQPLSCLLSSWVQSVTLLSCPKDTVLLASDLTSRSYTVSDSSFMMGPEPWGRGVGQICSTMQVFPWSRP